MERDRGCRAEAARDAEARAVKRVLNPIGVATIAAHAGTSETSSGPCRRARASRAPEWAWPRDVVDSTQRERARERRRRQRGHALPPLPDQGAPRRRGPRRRPGAARGGARPGTRDLPGAPRVHSVRQRSTRPRVRNQSRSISVPRCRHLARAASTRVSDPVRLPAMTYEAYAPAIAAGRESPRCRSLSSSSCSTRPSWCKSRRRLGGLERRVDQVI